MAVAAVLFGTSGVARGLGPDGADPVAVGAWRVVIGGLVLVVVAAFGRRPAAPAGPATVPTITRDRWWIALGGIATVGYQLAFFAAVDRVGVGPAAVVTIGTGPIVAGLAEWVVSRRAPAATRMVGVAVALAGIVVLSGTGGGAPHVHGAAIAGWLFAVTAGCCYPVYGLATQRLMTSRPPLTAVATVFGVGAALATPVAVVATVADTSTWGWRGVAMVAYLGVVATGLAYALWALGLARLSLGDTVALTLAEPVAAVLLAAVVLDEPLGAVRVAGMLVVLIGVAVATASHPVPTSG
ncbi:MAG: DMT family transporter [Acidimicrobiales bacterium]